MKIELYHNDSWFETFNIDNTPQAYNDLEKVLSGFYGGNWELIRWNTYSNGVIKATISDGFNCWECFDNGDTCQACCEHYEHDHFICLDCGREGEPSDYYNEDYGMER